MKDLKKAYLMGKGCINYLMESVPFLEVEDEPRISIIIKGMNNRFFVEQVK